MGCGGSTSSSSFLLSEVAALTTRVEAAEEKQRRIEEELKQLKLKHAHEKVIDEKEIVADPNEDDLPLQLEFGSVCVPRCLTPLPPLSHIPTEAECRQRNITYDVFISHKRVDAADFARVLHTELSDVAKLRCFLDQDADFELGDLMAKVRASRAIIFVLTTHILESDWCAMELREALAWGLEVVLLTAHGATWVVDGHSHDFPPPNIIRQEITQAFKNKGYKKRERQRGERDVIGPPLGPASLTVCLFIVSCD